MRLTLEKVQSFAKKHNGEFLSDEYEHFKTVYKWRCENNHVFEASYNDVSRRKHFCVECVYSLYPLKEIAEKRNGKCLSHSYLGMLSKHLWECDKGHIWEAVPASIKRGSWCPKCNLPEPLTLEELQKLAESRGGKLISSEYNNYGEKLKWMCSDGHIWQDSARHVKGSGRWCPKCNMFFSEEKCRFILESIFGKSFPKNRSVLGNQLELDGYNSNLNLAFEYHGEQHYKFKKHWHMTKELFQKRISDDLAKENLCESKGINLIVVPYDAFQSDKDLFNFIVSKAILYGYKVQMKFEDIDFNNFYKNFSVLREIKKIAESYGGECLSNEYIHSRQKLNFICKHGHQFEKDFHHLKHRNSWCQICGLKERGLKRRNTIEMMKEIALSRGGKCISDEYMGDSIHLEWECKEGHRWFAKPTNIKHKKYPTWCPTCKESRNNWRAKNA